MDSFTSKLFTLLGNRPIGFVDIGARGGVHPLVEPIASAVAVLGFEPDPAECDRIREEASIQSRYARMEIEAAALADHVGSAVLHHVSVPTNTSLRAPNGVFVTRYSMDKWREVGQSAIKITTLDEVLFSLRADDPYWGEAIKIDTQGTEHEILIGARRTLSERTLFLCVEVSFCELYKGQRLFSDVELALREFGFAFYGFDRVFHRSRKSLDKSRFWGRERVIQADAYFFKDPFDPAGIAASFSQRSRAILMAFALVTGYHDFALELLQSLDDEGTELREEILRQALLRTDASCAAAQQLVDAIAAQPQDANVLVGKFVDERRTRNDFFDVVLP
jgi:FkbM family methyltransferase